MVSALVVSHNDFGSDLHPMKFSAELEQAARDRIGLRHAIGKDLLHARVRNATLARTPDHKLNWAFLRPEEPAKFLEGTGKVMNTVPPNDFSYFELINELVQKEPVGALDPEIMGSLAAIGTHVATVRRCRPEAFLPRIPMDTPSALPHHL